MRVIHVHGFVRDGRPTSVQVTSYEGTLPDVARGVLSEIERQGHEVKVGRTWRISGELVEVEAQVVVDPEHPMWHVFTTESEPWKRGEVVA